MTVLGFIYARVIRMRMLIFLVLEAQLEEMKVRSDFSCFLFRHFPVSTFSVLTSSAPTTRANEAYLFRRR